MTYAFDVHAYAYRRLVAANGAPPGGHRRCQLLDDLAAAASRAEFNLIATQGARPVSGRYLREVIETRIWIADQDAETWHGAQHLARLRSRDRMQWNRAETILRDHGWLAQIGTVSRARHYRIEEGNVDPIGCSCEGLHRAGSL